MEQHRQRIQPRHVKVAVWGETELVVRGLQGMLGPFEDRLTLVPDRRGRPAIPCDLVLYEPSRIPGRTSAARSRRARVPGRMVAYSWDCSPEMVSTEMSRGAIGYLGKWLPAKRLVADLMRLAEGQVVIDVDPAPPGHHSDAEENEWPLTQRETEVLALIAAGRSNQELAEEMQLSINSVKSYIRSSYNKIQVTSRSQAVLWAVQHGLLLKQVESENPPEPASIR